MTSSVAAASSPSVPVSWRCLAGATYQGVATAFERREFPHPGRLIDIGGHQLHIYCTGDGSPTVDPRGAGDRHVGGVGRDPAGAWRRRRASAATTAPVSGGAKPATAPSSRTLSPQRTALRCSTAPASAARSSSSAHELGAAFARLLCRDVSDSEAAALVLSTSRRRAGAAAAGSVTPARVALAGATGLLARRHGCWSRRAESAAGTGGRRAAHVSQPARSSDPRGHGDGCAGTMPRGEGRRHAACRAVTAVPARRSRPECEPRCSRCSVPSTRRPMVAAVSRASRRRCAEPGRSLSPSCGSNATRRRSSRQRRLPAPRWRRCIQLEPMTFLRRRSLLLPFDRAETCPSFCRRRSLLVTGAAARSGCRIPSSPSTTRSGLRRTCRRRPSAAARPSRSPVTQPPARDHAARRGDSTFGEVTGHRRRHGRRRHG